MQEVLIMKYKFMLKFLVYIQWDNRSAVRLVMTEPACLVR